MSGPLNNFSEVPGNTLNEDPRNTTISVSDRQNFLDGDNAIFGDVQLTTLEADDMSTQAIIVPTVTAGTIQADLYVGLPPLDLQKLELKQGAAGTEALTIESTNRTAIRIKDDTGAYSEINLGYMSGLLNSNLDLKSLGNDTGEGVRLLRNNNTVGLAMLEGGSTVVNRSASNHSHAYKLEVAGNSIVDGTGSVQFTDGDLNVTGDLRRNGALWMPQLSQEITIVSPFWNGSSGNLTLLNDNVVLVNLILWGTSPEGETIAIVENTEWQPVSTVFVKSILLTSTQNGISIEAPGEAYLFRVPINFTYIRQS